MNSLQEKLEYMGIPSDCEVGDQFIYNNTMFDVTYTCVEKRPVSHNNKISHYEFYFEPSPKEYVYDGITYPYLTCNMRIEFLHDFLLRRIWIRKPKSE